MAPSKIPSNATIKFAETQRDRYASFVNFETMALKRVKHCSLQKAPVAQLDRALASEARGHRFESCRVRQPAKKPWL